MDRLAQVLEKFEGLRVLVVGDLMVDEHVWGNATRVSPEAPVLVVEAAGDPEVLPGGAANVVNNIRALGGSAAVIGVIGDDVYGRELDRHLAGLGVDTSGLVVDPARVTTRKTRIWVSHRQQIVRVDHECRDPVNDAVARQVVSRIRDELPCCDAVILSDYDKGVLTPFVSQEAVRLARELGKTCAVNPKPENVLGFKGASVIVVNQSEAEVVSGSKVGDEKSVLAAGRAMLSGLAADCVVITRGSLGLSVFAEGLAQTIPAIPIEVYDVAGAGDTVVGAITLSIAAGAGPVEAGRIGNFAGGAAVRKVGVAAVSRDEILALYGDSPMA